jgi:hypothetical protein
MEYENVFLGLSKNMPKENYLTNCFAYLLRNDKKLLLFLLDHITKGRKDLINIQNIRGHNYKVETQVSFYNGIIDMMIELEDGPKILIENKIGKPNASQLRKYLKYGHPLILITKNSLPKDIEKDGEISANKRFFYITWKKIVDLFESYLECNKKYKRYKIFISQFLKYISEQMGIEPFSGFKQEYGPSWQKYVEFKKNAKAIMEEIKEKMEKKGLKSSDWNYNEIEFGYEFRTKKYGWKFYYYVGFGLNHHVHINVGIWFQKKFREFVRKNYEETENISEKLRKKGFCITWDKDKLNRVEYLKDLIKATKQKDEQKKKIIDFITETINHLEESGLINILEKAAKEYK